MLFPSRGRGNILAAMQTTCQTGPSVHPSIHPSLLPSLHPLIPPSLPPSLHPSTPCRRGWTCSTLRLPQPLSGPCDDALAQHRLWGLIFQGRTKLTQRMNPRQEHNLLCCKILSKAEIQQDFSIAFSTSPTPLEIKQLCQEPSVGFCTLETPWS